MQLPANFEELISKTEDLELYSKLIKQVNKDFLLANIDLDFDEEILPSSLKYLLHEAVFELTISKSRIFLIPSVPIIQRNLGHCHSFFSTDG